MRVSELPLPDFNDYPTDEIDRYVAVLCRRCGTQGLAAEVRGELHCATCGQRSSSTDVPITWPANAAEDGR